MPAEDVTAEAAAGADSSAAAAAVGISPQLRGLLDTIAGPESGGRYNIRYSPQGGAEFSDLSVHPNIPEAIPGKPGYYSTAAGKYQFIKPTWDAAAKATGATDFSPASQDTNAAWLARKTWQQATGRDLDTDLLSNDPQMQQHIKSVLASQWESLKGGAAKPVQTPIEMSLGQQPQAGTSVTPAGGNALTLPPPPAGAGEASPAVALQLLQLLAPKGHSLQAVDYDPWKIQRGMRSNG